MGRLMEVLKDLSQNKIAIYYAIFVLIVAFSLGILKIMDTNYQNDVVDLMKEYNVNLEKGEVLVDCNDGSYDVYKPEENQDTVCGQMINNNNYNINIS